MSTLQEELLTIDEFARLPDDGRPKELVRGRVVEMNQPKARHGQICATIVCLYGGYARENEVGHIVSNDTGVIVERGPDTIRGADIAFYSYSQVPKGPLPAEYLTVPPAVVFEVLSPDDRWPKVWGKLSEYLEAGVAVVCVVDPQQETVQIYRPDGSTESLREDDELTLKEFAAEFNVPVQRIFE